jgi:hypothetical protein
VYIAAHEKLERWRRAGRENEEKKFRMMATASMSEPTVNVVPRWSVATRVAFRFSFIYFGLYILLTQMLTSLVPFIPVEIGSLGPFRAVVSWTAKHMFHVGHALVVTGSGSGDKTFDWVETFCILVIAIIATAIWSILDRKRQSYGKLYSWFRVFIRLSLGATMFSYGAAKVLPLQMPFPGLNQLLEHYGDLSPMGVLWASIGAAKGYEIFAGSAELAGGIFLFFPRTTMFGALICLADAINIFTLNMTYDVPVKLFAFELILLAIFLLAPDARRFANVFFLDRAAPPSSQKPLFRGRLANRIAVAVQILVGVALLATNLYGSVQYERTSGAGAAKSPLYGIWTVEDFSLDGQARPPLLTDNTRWRRVIFESFGENSEYANIQQMDEKDHYYGVNVNMGAKTVALTKSADAKWKANFSFLQPAPGQLVLDGSIDGHKVHARLELFDRSKFLLVSRGFHWVQEYPFNR